MFSKNKARLSYFTKLYSRKMIKKMKDKVDFYFIFLFILLLTFTFYNLFIVNEPFVGADHASRIFEIGRHELSQMYILKPIFDKNLSYLNILIINIYFISITYYGYLIILIVSKNIKSLSNFIYQNKEIFFISSFVIGSIFFNGFVRFISLNLSITSLNFLIILFIISSLFFIFNFLVNNWKKLFNYKTLLILFLFFFLLINNIQIDGHHISGDSFYHYGYLNLIKSFLKLDLIPIIGGHYFEPLIVTPITFLLQDFFFFNTFEQSVFLSNWFFQAYAKTSGFFLIFFTCKYFFQNQKILIPVIFALFLFFSNYSGHFFINPLLYDSGSPLALSINGSRVIGITSFIFSVIFIFEFNNSENKINDNRRIKSINGLLIFFFIIGLNSLGIQFIFLYLLLISFIFLKSLTNNFKFYKINNKIFFISAIILISIFLSYTIIGRNFSITHWSSYIMIGSTILSASIYYLFATKLVSNTFELKNIFILKLFYFFSLIFLGNFFTFIFLFDQSNSKFEIFLYINKIFSILSFANSKISEHGLYNSLILYDKTNDYLLMNICSFKDKIDLFMTGVPNYHCINLQRLIYGSGLIFLILIYNSLKALTLIKNISNEKLNKKYEISLFFYFLSIFFYTLSLTYADMLSGSYLLHSRTRFLEVANILILINFVMLFSIEYKNNAINKQIIITLIIIKIFSPFLLNLNIIKNYKNLNSEAYYNNWYINQWTNNLKFLKKNY